MRTLYFDCFAGASGNMILGGLIALGVDVAYLTEELKKLEIADFELSVSTVDRSGIAATHVNVSVPHEHVHRHLGDIEAIIGRSRLSNGVKARAIDVFKRLAAAEAKIHGTSIENVHFHEVGAMDAIVDIVGACIGFESLGIDRFCCSRIHVGSGFVDIAHGRFPIPPPAVVELLSGVPLYSGDIEGELMTPTGAAIISTVCDTYGHIPEMTVEQTGYGAGTREYQRFPNVLRLMLGESDTMPQEISDSLLLLETNVDDLSPQVLGYVMERVFDLGALDCWFTPVYMKKNRPATMISLLCEPKDCDVLKAFVFRETTTLGIRTRTVERECLEREIVTVHTEYGEIDVKTAKFGGTTVNSMPEYDQVKRAALDSGVPFRTVQDSAVKALAGVRPATRSAAHD